MEYLVFGPVPSRRLGNSLGINNIPPKICSYSCVYCQLGSTIDMHTNRMNFYPVEKIVDAVKSRVQETEAAGNKIDYLTFVPDGEPTLDINIGKEIKGLKGLGIKIAVITNSSLIWMRDVMDDLLNADWVSLKVDTVIPSIWREINRPSEDLDLIRIMSGMEKFSQEFDGFLATETLLVQNLNDSEENIRKTAQFIEKLRPDKSYISIPTRPPAEKWVSPPHEEVVTKAYLTFRNLLNNVELLTGYEGTSFFYTGDVEQDILSITSVHPMREDAVRELLGKSKKNWSLVEAMLREDKLKEVVYKGNKYYVAKFLRVLQ